jgi:hypothetical protein
MYSTQAKIVEMQKYQCRVFLGPKKRGEEGGISFLKAKGGIFFRLFFCLTNPSQD